MSSCIIACSTDYENGLKDCPCMEGCPGGCPCENWDCTLQVCWFDFDCTDLILFCSVVLKISTTSIHVKMLFQSSSVNALKVVVLYLHASSNVPTIMKLLLKTVHAWKVVQEDVHVQTGIVMQLFQVRLVENYNSKFDWYFNSKLDRDLD